MLRAVRADAEAEKNQLEAGLAKLRRQVREGQQEQRQKIAKFRADMHDQLASAVAANKRLRGQLEQRRKAALERSRKAGARTAQLAQPRQLGQGQGQAKPARRVSSHGAAGGGGRARLVSRIELKDYPLPFVVGQSVAPSYSVPVNLQEILARQPMALSKEAREQALGQGQLHGHGLLQAPAHLDGDGESQAWDDGGVGYSIGHGAASASRPAYTSGAPQPGPGRAVGPASLDAEFDLAGFERAQGQAALGPSPRAAFADSLTGVAPRTPAQTQPPLQQWSHVHPLSQPESQSQPRQPSRPGTAQKLSGKPPRPRPASAKGGAISQAAAGAGASESASSSRASSRRASLSGAGAGVGPAGREFLPQTAPRPQTAQPRAIFAQSTQRGQQQPPSSARTAAVPAASASATAAAAVSVSARPSAVSASALDREEAALAQARERSEDEARTRAAKELAGHVVALEIELRDLNRRYTQELRQSKDVDPQELAANQLLLTLIKELDAKGRRLAQLKERQAELETDDELHRSQRADVSVAPFPSSAPSSPAPQLRQSASSSALRVRPSSRQMAHSASRASVAGGSRHASPAGKAQGQAAATAISGADASPAPADTYEKKVHSLRLLSEFKKMFDPATLNQSA